MRYAIDSKKIKKQLNWKTKENFMSGLEKTFKWYSSNRSYFLNFDKKDIIQRLGKKND